MPPKKTDKATPKAAVKKRVESIQHKDRRKNIPTEELRDFVVDEETQPKTMLYPRDPSPATPVASPWLWPGRA